MTPEELVTRWGAAAVFVGAGVEGETAAVTGGLLAHRHLIPLWASALAACTGSFVADQCFFLIGRYFRDHPRVRALAAKPAFAKALAALERHPTVFILSFRFLYGLRTISPLAIGGSSVPFARFVFLNAIAATAWGLIFTGLGYAFGKGIETFFGRLLTTRHVLLIVAVLVVAAAIYGGVRFYRRRPGRRAPGASHVKRWMSAALVGAGVAAAVVARRRLTELPSLKGRSVSESLRGADDTRLARAIAPLLQAHPGLSGVHPLIEGHDAFAARVVLADAAERSLDVQYYIWEADLTGTLLFEALRRAAERGVRVRLLLDDNRTVGTDPVLAELDAHPRIEVRLFNPFVIRSSRLVGYATDFTRLNRRMHNKSFTADGRATVIGGRNIADHYFATTAGSLFMDFDVLAVGAAADAVAAEFDRYWACGSSYPAAAILRVVKPAEQARTRARAATLIGGPEARAFGDAVRDYHAVGALLDGRLPFDWAEVRLLSDDPAKGLGASPPGGLLVDHLKDALGPPRRELRIVSGYLVPSAADVRLFTEMAARGVCVTMLTNGFRAANVMPVFAAYSRWRRPLLAAGIRLFEVRNPAPGAPFAKPGGSGLTGSVGSSGAAFLHAKTFGVNRDRVFIGSFNFDPRSARLNTEQGFVIESPALATRMADRLAVILPETSYEVHLGDDGHLFWTKELNGVTVRHDVEPGTSRVTRTGMRALSHLRLDWLL